MIFSIKLNPFEKKTFLINDKLSVSYTEFKNHFMINQN
jgi:hypothetical protein